MLRALLRFVGYIVDGARYIANNEWSFLAIGTAIDAVLPRSYSGWEDRAKLHLPAYLWDPVLVKTLAAPFFVGATVIAVLLLLLGRKPKAQIGYSSRD